MILEDLRLDEPREALERHSADQAAAEPTLWDRTQALVIGLSTVLKHHGAGDSLIVQLKEQLHRYLGDCTDEGGWSSRAKHMLNSPLNQYLRNPPAIQEFPDFKASGSLLRWMRPRLHRFSRKNTALWYSWFQAKRAALPASESLIEATYLKHRNTLTKPDEGDDTIIDQIMDLPVFKGVLTRIRNSVAASIAMGNFTQTQPSTHASFESTRGQGGSQAALRDLVGLETSVSAKIGNFQELSSMRYDPVVLSLESRQVHYGVLEHVYRAPGAEDWSELQAKLGEWDLSKPLDCMIQGIVEPLKVRVISKGPALPYYSQKPLQKAMHAAIRHMPCFRLTGQTFDPTMLIDLKASVEPGCEWLSIDYSAATDGLSWSYSGRILQEVVGKLSLIDQMRAFSVLGPHNIHYPKDCVPPGLQQNGQLMGSPLSFPILCLANLGVYLLANHERFSALGWDEDQILSHVLCNGDDMLYAAPHAIWDRHVQIGRSVGLAMSPGKAYTHTVYSNINSVSCHFDLNDEKSTPWQVNFLNTGLYFGQHKVLSKKKNLVGKTSMSLEDWKEAKAEARLRKQQVLDDLVSVKIDILPESLVDREVQMSEQLLESVDRARRGEPEEGENLCSVINLLLAGCLPGKECQILGSFLELHKKTIEQECRTVVGVGRGRKRFHLITRNLFLPISRGGMGVVAPIGWKFEVTANQRMFSYLLESMNRIPFVPSCCPLPGFEPGDVRTVEIMPFDVHVDKSNIFDPSKRPFSFNPKFLRRFRRGHVEIDVGIRYYSPMSSVLVRKVRQPTLVGKPLNSRVRPALTEAQKEIKRPRFDEVSRLPMRLWSDQEDPLIWEPDQVYDRFKNDRLNVSQE